MKKLLLILCLLIKILPNAFTQSLDIIKNDSLLLATLKQEKFGVDSNAQAVILSRKITSHILYKKVTSYKFEESYEYTVDFTAKILSDEAAINLSLINIPRFYRTTVVNITGQTYNLEGNTIVKQELDKQEVMRENYTDGIDIIKFNLPSVKKGSVIHYTYKTLQPSFLNIPDQYLQLEYPILSETYELSYPYYLDCKEISRINVPLIQASSPEQLESCEACVLRANYSEETGSYYKWARKNVPAFKKEVFMGAEENYKERIRMQIQTVLIAGIIRNYLDSWDDFSKNFLYENQNFIGQVFKGNGFLGDKVEQLTKGKTTELDRAKSIYCFVRDSFNVKYTDKDFSLRSVFNNKEGTEKEINLLLVAMLRKANLKCAPLYLSPKPNEKLNPIFPDNNNLRVLVASLHIDNNDIYLDASKHQLPFGIILPENYNGYARLVDERGKGITLDPNSISEKSITVANIKPGEKSSQIVLTLDNRLGVFEAYNFRKKWAADTNEMRKTFIKHVESDNQGFVLSKFKAENLNNPDEALKIHIEATLDLDNSNMIYLNPYFAKTIDKNPFSSISRNYPIEMENLENKTYILSIQLPTGYAIDDYPKSIKYKLNEAGNMLQENVYSLDTSSNVLTIRTSFQTNECVYPPAQYNAIRAFYDKCIESQNEKIVIKKIPLNNN